MTRGIQYCEELVLCLEEAHPKVNGDSSHPFLLILIQHPSELEAPLPIFFTLLFIFVHGLRVHLS